MPLHHNDDLRIVTLFGRKYFWHWNGRYELKPVLKGGIATARALEAK